LGGSRFQENPDAIRILELFKKRAFLYERFTKRDRTVHDEKSGEKISTHLASNILLTILCFPPFAAFSMLLCLEIGSRKSSVFLFALLFLLINIIGTFI